MEKKLYGVVVIRDAREIIDNPPEPYTVRTCVFNNAFEQLNFYAETPCTWSKCIEANTEKDLEEMAVDVYLSFLNGDYEKYM